MKTGALFVWSGDGEWMVPDFGFMNDTELMSAQEFGSSCAVGSTGVAVSLLAVFAPAVVPMFHGFLWL